jgi:hypothetical protein
LTGTNIFGISGALSQLENWKIRPLADTRLEFHSSLLLSKQARVLMAFSKIQERKQTEFSNRPQPISAKTGATIIGPTNPTREAENPDTLAPPRQDPGTMANLRWSFADSHIHLPDGGRELPVATEVAGVNMRLTAGGVREMHWHKAAEWAYMLKGWARITAIDHLPAQRLS